jgi:hypothetical protein
MGLNHFQKSSLKTFQRRPRISRMILFTGGR